MAAAKAGEVELGNISPDTCPLCDRQFTREEQGRNEFAFWCEDCRYTASEAFETAIWDAIETGMERAELSNFEPEDLRRIVYLLDASGGDWTGVLGKGPVNLDGTLNPEGAVTLLTDSIINGATWDKLDPSALAVQKVYLPSAVK